MSRTIRNVRVFEDPVSLATAAAAEFYARVHRAREDSRIFRCALSGGTTPSLLFERLADKGTLAPLPVGFWDSVHFFWGDERDVPPDHPDSNYRLAREILLNKIDIPERNIHRIRPESGGALPAAVEYESELKRCFGILQGELPGFDLIFLGLGEDGHTASLFPHSKVLHEGKRLVAAPWVEKLNCFRITLTLPVINNAACVIFLVRGDSKAETLRQVLSDPKTSDPLPAQAIQPIRGELLWLVDRAAAGLPAKAIRQ